MKYFENYDKWLFEKARSMISYYGSKYSIVDTLSQHFPKKGISQFLDLFCGGANVAINVNYSKKICNDVNSDLINLYKYVQKNDYKILKKEILKIVNNFGLMDVNIEGYNELKKSHFQDRSPIKLYVLTSSSFHGIMRFNQKGGFNTGYHHKPFQQDLVFSKLNTFKQQIKKIKFINKYFNKIKPNKRTFVYVDPPYLITKADYNKIWKKSDEIKLLDYLDALNKKGIKFGLSNVLTHDGKSNDLLIEWSKKYKVIPIDKKYTVSKSDIQNTQEVLIINY